MKNERIHKGHITYINKEKKYGFVEKENNSSYFFYFGDNTKNSYLKGDIVNFKLKASEKNDNLEVAFDLKKICNPDAEWLLKEHNEKKHLEGYLKCIGEGKYLVKHTETYLKIPIHISIWENNLKQIYDDRINEKVKFKLIENKLPRLFAYLTDINFCPELKELQNIVKSKLNTMALITGKNHQGYFATILEGKVKGFIYSDNHYSKNDLVNVRIKRISEKSRQVTLILI